MKYKVTHTTKYAYSENASLCQNKLHLAPRRLPHQKLIDFRLVVSPDPQSLSSSEDYFGNRVDYFEIAKPHHGLSVTAISRVTLAPVTIPLQQQNSLAWETIADGLRTDRVSDSLENYHFVFPSKLVPVNADLAAFARESFTPRRPILDATLDLTRRIHQDFTYDPRATTVTTPVMEVFRHRSGVCQDFAHLQIACLRSIGLAARYVSGYLRTEPPPGKPHVEGSDESHAWLSVYCGGELGWVDVDPTNNVIPGLDHITVGWGQDYADLCPIQGVVTGGGPSKMTVSVDVKLLEASH